jgi:hypothetical protein
VAFWNIFNMCRLKLEKVLCVYFKLSEIGSGRECEKDGGLVPLWQLCNFCICENSQGVT